MKPDRASRPLVGWRPVFVSILLPLFVHAQGVQLSYEEMQRLILEGRHREAITALERETKVRPGDVRLHNLLGIALTADGDAMRGNTEFQTCIRLNPLLHQVRENFSVAREGARNVGAGGVPILAQIGKEAAAVGADGALLLSV